MNTKKWWVVCCAALVGGVLSAGGETQPGCSVSFDAGVTAEKAAGSANGRSTGLIIADGLFGKAAVAGVTRRTGEKSEGYSCAYAADKNIRAERGTVVFWVKPVDWSGHDGHVHLFFEALGGNSCLRIYKYDVADNPLGFMFGPSKPVDGKQPWTMARISATSWKPDDWHLIACSWDAERLKLYVDGELKVSQKIAVPPATPFATIYVGGNCPAAWSNTGPGKTLIDELKIYDAPLGIEEVHRMWEQGAARFAKKKAPLPDGRQDKSPAGT